LGELLSVREHDRSKRNPDYAPNTAEDHNDEEQ
jgi:hypothetical protein